MLIEFILSLSFHSLFWGIIFQSFMCFHFSSQELYALADRIALRQMERILQISYDLSFQEKQLSFRYQGKEFQLSAREDKLLLQPGVQIFMQDADSIYFDARGGILYLHWQRGEVNYEYPICNEKRFSLDDFPIVSDDGDGSISSFDNENANQY